VGRIARPGAALRRGLEGARAASALVLSVAACQAQAPAPPPAAPVVAVPVATHAPPPATSPAPPPPRLSPPAGDGATPMPAFHAAGLGSTAAVDASMLAGKVGVVAFWASFAEPCKLMLPKLQELRARFAERGFEVIGVSEDDRSDEASARAFLAQLGVQFPAGIDDDDHGVAAAWRLNAMPAYFVVDRRGGVRSVHLGWRDGDAAALAREIEDLL